MALRKVALFDMDKTLISRNSAELYIQWQRARGEATTWDQLKLSGWLLQYAVGWLDAPRVAERVIRGYAGTREQELRDRCDEWFMSSVEIFVSEAGQRAVERHKARGDLTGIVTASTLYASEPLKRKLGLDFVISTELELDDQGCLTGRYVKPLCYGPGKVERVERLLRSYDLSLADACFYSDSITDLPLLEAVAERVVINPDRRLARLARSRGWTIERW